ncbi:hypothetical protein [Hymenobacter volaticus]|uniref:Uncharacterized protein n=1 Tax=Hymenobacter volaticus TaxID=2932254 RepID=A0ABY4G3F4_9BACT|nr:hypothetical protein [Hymenobacter volaticus]UOQ65410.1 hypothetical protein MUN86_17920 [Hymenobacter volaticus]
MRYPYFLSLFLLLTLLLSNCKKDNTSISDNLIGRTWLFSYEGSKDGVDVYRPNTYAFPPSRGRVGFRFDPDGQFTQLHIAPTDGLEAHEGTWTPLSNTLFYISFNDNKGANYKLHIISLDNDVLRVKH